MSTNPSQTHGKFNEGLGNVQHGAGNVAGNERAANQAQSQTEQSQGKTKNYISGATDRLAGATKSGLHSMTGNQTAKAQGEAKQSMAKHV
ncbi:hypothetical protein H4R33_006145 [Dimargaris cristalligena]|nr:hypothetical protein H4R33_006145 [Dimargaris cristalligena]